MLSLVNSIYAISRPVAFGPRVIRSDVFVAVSSSCSRRYSKQVQTPQDTSASTKPSEEQLVAVKDALARCLPKFFYTSHEYNIYNANVIFEDNIRNIRTVGMSAYIRHLSMIRVLSHLRYAQVQMHVIKVTHHVEDSSVKVRWRVSGVSGLRVFLAFWKFRVWKFKEMFSRHQEWTDGFSVMYVGGDGKIWKHVAEKVMPDGDHVVARNDVAKASLASALVVATTLSSEAGNEIVKLL